VQIRQDFSKNLINVLQTGFVEPDAGRHQRGAANSQALSTRQSIAVSRAGAGQPSRSRACSSFLR